MSQAGPFDFDRVIARADTASVKFDARLEVFGSAEVIPLWVADMDFASPDVVVQALRERAEHPVYGYSLYPTPAYEALIQWLQVTQGWRVQREHVLMCPGVVPSLYAAVQAFTAVGEAVIVQPPVYLPFFSAITESGRRVLENPLILQDGVYSMDIAQLERCARSGARLLLLCSPHNPVGRVWREEELQAVLRISRQYGLVILSDEIHADLIYEGHRHLPLAALATHGEPVITAVAPSKTFNIPGLGLSALIATDSGHRQQLQRVFDRLHVSASNPFSVAAFTAAYERGEPWRNELMNYLKTTRDELVEFVQTYLPGIDVVVPEGTYLIWLDCRGLGMADAQLRQFFIEQAGVGLSPGIGFGESGSGFMRLNMASPRAVIAGALERMRQALDVNKG